MTRGESDSPAGPSGSRRVMLKLSGEILGGEAGQGLDNTVLTSIASQIREVCESGVGVAVVIGAGNFIRGETLSRSGMDRVRADTIGMLATVINAMAMQDSLERQGVSARVLSALRTEQAAEPYMQRSAVRHLEKGRVVIMAGGTGNPYFSTDTAAVLRALETGCSMLYKGTKVDGVYSADPAVHPGASRFERLTYKQVLDQRLRVMDLTAVTLARENRLPITVFDIRTPGNLVKAVGGEPVGTLVEENS